MLHTKVQSIIKELNATYFERGDYVESAVIALLAGQHHFAVGSPGSAKSALIRDLSSRLTGAKYFECLLSKTSPAESVLGPLDLPKLRDTGSFIRKTDGFLPDAHIAFIDELGNASQTLGHNLHGLMFERVLHEVGDNGRSVHHVPLSTAFCAGNFLPGDGSEESAALWDRILLRVAVEYIQSNSSFSKMCLAPMNDKKTTVDWNEFVEAMSEVQNVSISDDVIAQVIDLKNKLSKLDNPIILSDRRWRASMSALKASAWLNGRTEVTVQDIQVFKYIAWSEEGQIKTVERVVNSIADKTTEQIKSLIDDLMKQHKTIIDREGKSENERGSHARSVKKKLEPIKQQIRRLKIENATHKDLPALERAYTKTWNAIFTVLLKAEIAPVDL